MPAAGAVLADLGADVIKVEEPGVGDPYRGLVTQGIATVHEGVNYSVEQANRGKRTVGIDLKTEEGLELIYRLAASADVFLTSFRPGRARPASTSGSTTSGGATRGSSTSAVTAPACGARRSTGPGTTPPPTGPGARWPTPSRRLRRIAPITQRPAFGDRTGAMNLAFGIAAALFHRERTGEPSVVDVSLLASATWVLATDVLNATVPGHDPSAPRPAGPATRWSTASAPRTGGGSAWCSSSPTATGPTCAGIWAGPSSSPTRASPTPRPGPRTPTSAPPLLAEAFASRPYAEWCEILGGLDAPWAPLQSVSELLTDPQLRGQRLSCRRWRRPTGRRSASSVPRCSSTSSRRRLRRAPEPGEHTEEVLLELGLSWDEIAAHKECGAIS